MDHLSIYESGIVNPYRNKNNDIGKSYFCPPNAAGSRKPIVSTRTLIVIVIVIVSIASYMLHLHISSESVLKGKTTTLRGYVKEKPISNLDPQIDKLKDSVHNVAESIVIEPVSIGLQQKNPQKINKILVKKAANDSSSLNFAGNRLRGNYIPLAASSTVESTVIKTTVDNMNSRISEVDALSSKLSNIETNSQSTKENLSIAIKGNGGGFNSTLFVVDQIPAALSPVVPSTIDTENLGTTSVGIGASRDESLASKQGGNNNRSGVFIQADIIPSVSPTVALIAFTMPTSPARLGLLVANTSALRVSTHGCAHGLSCNSSAISTKEPPSSSHNATTGLSTISTTELPSEIPTPNPTLAPTYSPLSSFPSKGTATSTVVDPQLASASNTTASPPSINSHVNSTTTTTLSPTIATTSSPTIATTSITVPSPTIALNTTASAPTIASQTTTILSPTIALNTTATSTSTTSTESSPNIALNTTTSYPMIASQTTTTTTTTTTLSPIIATTIASTTTTVSSPTIALNTTTSSPTIVSTTTATVPTPTIATTIAAMTTTVSSPATALNTTESSPTIAPTTTATVPSPTIAPNTTISSSTATLKNSASPLTANTITNISSPISNTTTSSLASDSASMIATNTSTMDSQSTIPSAATTTSPTIIDSHSSKAVTAVTTSKAGPLVVVVSNPITAVEDALKSDGQQQVPVVVEKKPFVIDMQEESVIHHPTIAPTAAVVESEEQAEVEIKVQEHEVLAPAQSKMEELIEQIKAPDLQSIDKLIDRQEDQDQQVIGDHAKVVTADSSKVDYCKGNVDPFEGQSIEHFKPPASASFDKAVAWKSAVQSMVESIGQLKIGGKELRLKMKSELERLRVLRFELFCAFA